MDITSTLLTITLIESSILHIHLNRPASLNALNSALLTALDETLSNAKNNPAIKGILLTGEGKGFCAGADIQELLPLNQESGLRFARNGQRIFQNLEDLGKPSVAAIHGFALGGGLELAMAATLRIATVDTVFSQPEIKLGLIPGFGGTQRLPRLIGQGRALEMCLTGNRVSAEKALEWGLINAMVSPDDRISKAVSLLNSMLSFSKTAIHSLMETIHHGYPLPLKEALALEANHFAVCCDTDEKRENVNAFLERKKS